MPHNPDEQRIAHTHNLPRFILENRQISWVLLIASLAWGIFGYRGMPQRKDPEIPVRKAVAITAWPGTSAEKIEQLVTRKIEEKVGENAKVTKIESISQTNVSIVYVELDEGVKETGKEFDDVKMKLDSIHDLPAGAGPINFIKDFGDTAALMLTVATPHADPVEISLRSDQVRQAIEQARGSAAHLGSVSGQRVSMVICLPMGISPRLVHSLLALFQNAALHDRIFTDLKPLEKPGLIGVDGITRLTDDELRRYLQRFLSERLQQPEIHPDAWSPAIIHDPAETTARLTESAGFKYSLHDLDVFTDLIAKQLKSVPQVARVTRSGILPESIQLYYSQDRLAAYGLRPWKLPEILNARNSSLPGGVLNAQGRNMTLDPTGEFHSEKELGNVLVSASSTGAPVYLRDLVDVVRTYQVPARFLNYITTRSANGEWVRAPAITLAVQMRSGEQIGEFGKAVNLALDDLKPRLPSDLVIRRTSDQPEQVTENVRLFMASLYEAIVLVVIVSLIGFWDWRSALMMALSIPVTLAITYGMLFVCGIDLQQVSIASLIIALGLLVDVPIVAGDAIKRELGGGHLPAIAAWLGPTKLATAILYATITNVVAYLPFLALGGDTGRFLYSLPVVITCSLGASYLVAMTFIPLIGRLLLKPVQEESVQEKRKHGFFKLYFQAGSFAIQHRWLVLGVSLIFLATGGVLFVGLRQQFFPKDLSYLSYIDVWLPEDAPLDVTNRTAALAEKVIRETAEEYGRTHAHGQKTDGALASLTTYVGGGGPRFWFSVEPEMQQLNYAQILVQVRDNHDTAPLVGLLQAALTRQVPGARIDVRQLETGKPVGVPVAVRLSGPDIGELRRYANELKAIFATTPLAARIRDDWGGESFAVELQTDPDRANFAGLTNGEVAASSAAALSGYPVTTLREGDKQIPVVAQLRMEERARITDLNNLYVYSTQGDNRVPLRQVAHLDYELKSEKIRRRNQFRTITVSAYPAEGYLPSQVMNEIQPKLDAFTKKLPSGYHLETGGEKEEQVQGFVQLAGVLGISIGLIYLALVFQFRHAIKPLVVFAAIPYGITGAIIALWLMHAPFGFMAFLGVASLVGVIVSHIIVLFDFIEEARERGEPLKEALLDAGIIRLRPVMITVVAFLIALFPLALHGGPLWEPLCYAQIGGLSVATFVTLLMVPVIYSIFVLDLKIVKWETPKDEPTP